MRSLSACLVLVLTMMTQTTTLAQSDSRPKDQALSAPIAELTEHDGAVHALDFSPKHNYLATFEGRTVRVWDAKSWKIIKTLSGPDADFNHGVVTFSPNGKLLAVAGDDSVMIWAVGKKWKPIKRIELISTEFSGEVPDEIDFTTVSALSFGPKSRLLFAGGDSRSIRAWSTKSWAPQGEIKDHTRLKNKNSASGLPPIEGLELPPGVSLTESRSCEVDFIAFSHRGKVFASGGQTHALRLRSRSKKGWRTYGTIKEREGAKIASHRTDARFSPDDSLLATCVADGRLEIIDVKEGKTIHDIQAHTTPGFSALSVEFTADGKRVLAGGSSLQLWDARTGKLVENLEVPAIVRVVRRARDGKHYAVSCDDGIVRIFRIQDAP